MASYNAVEKNRFVFTPLRAIGLAVELAHKVAKAKGSGAVTARDVGELQLSGDSLRVKELGKWRKATSVKMQVPEQDRKATAINKQIENKQ